MSLRALNRIMLIGNIGQEPRLGSIKPGTIVCSFNMATNRFWIVKNTGEKKNKRI